MSKREQQTEAREGEAQEAPSSSSLLNYEKSHLRGGRGVLGGVLGGVVVQDPTASFGSDHDPSKQERRIYGIFLFSCLMAVSFMAFQFLRIWFFAAMYDRHSGGGTHHSSSLL
jgi:hypothetical protein